MERHLLLRSIQSWLLGVCDTNAVQEVPRGACSAPVPSHPKIERVHLPNRGHAKASKAILSKKAECLNTYLAASLCINVLSEASIIENGPLCFKLCLLVYQYVLL